MSWREILLGDGLHIKHGYAFKGQHFASSGTHVVLTPGNFYEEGGFRLRPGKDRFYEAEIPEDFILSDGDVIVAMTEQGPGLLGSSALIPEDNRYLHNQRLGLVDRVDSSVFDKIFLYYLFNTKAVRHQISASASGTKVRHTAPERIYRVKVRVPDVAAQGAIGRILRTYDQLIDNNRRRIQLLDEAAQILYREWFVRLCFPGHEHTPVIDGCPSGWQWKTLESVCAGLDGIQTGPFGSQLHQSDYTEDGVPVVMPKDIVGLQISTDSIARIPEFIAERLSRHRMSENDIVYGRRGEIGRRAFISKRRVGWLCGTGCLRFRPNPDLVEPRYLFDTLGSPLTAGTIVNRAKGATMPNLNASVLKSVPVLIPPLSLQQTYTEYIRPIVELSETLGEQNRNLQIARDMLLPQLLGGAIAV